LHQTYFDGLRVSRGEVLEKQGIFPLGALRGQLGQTLSGERLDGRQQTTGAVFGVSVMLFSSSSRLWVQRGHGLTNQIAGALIKADDRIVRVLGQSVKMQQLFHAGKKVTVESG
jgi:hypothetical protein